MKPPTIATISQADQRLRPTQLGRPLAASQPCPTECVIQSSLPFHTGEDEYVLRFGEFKEGSAGDSLLFAARGLRRLHRHASEKQTATGDNLSVHG
jgi:hypothetical protein